MAYLEQCRNASGVAVELIWPAQGKNRLEV
jgi:hypothetical protein